MSFDKNKLNIIFFGGPEFSLSAFSSLLKNGYFVGAVICNPDRAQGRKREIIFSPLKQAAREQNIEVMQPEDLRDPQTIRQIKKLKPDLLVVSAYGQIIPQALLDGAPLGGLNIHPSLLPKYRGPSPIQYAIVNGDQETGVTVMLMDEKMDHGPILAQKKVPIASGETGKTLAAKLAKEGAAALIETLPLWLSATGGSAGGGEITPQPQDDEEATYTELLTREFGKINWDESAEKIERQIRAFHPWPGTYAGFKAKEDIKRLKILKAKIGLPVRSSEGAKESWQYGQVFLNENNELSVQTAEGYLILEQVHLQGKKPLSAQEFFRGYPDIIGKILS